MQTIEELLRSKKIKVTPQRMAVYAVLKQTKEHPNVEMIYKKLKPDYPAISLATVYKTVDILKKIGLIQELNIGDGSLRFDSNTNPHAHVYCKNCGKVTDVENVSFEQLQDQLLMKNVMEETGFDVSSIQLYFYGLCFHCQNKSKNTASDM
ncbi:MAG: Fur family transcriptional regulator [Dethiobacteria bacterium]|jgi:Fur family peroxide stress response transcriptional regulator